MMDYKNVSKLKKKKNISQILEKTVKFLHINSQEFYMFVY